MFRGTGRSSTSKSGGSSRLNIGRGTSGKTSLKTPEGAHGEPLIASKSSNVVSSCITFSALDLITRPDPFRATKCSSVWKRFPSHVPTCHLAVMTAPASQQLSTSLLHRMGGAPLDVVVSSTAHTQICHHPPHGTFTCSECPLRAQQSTETLASGRDKTPVSTRKIEKKHSCHLLN